MPREVALISEGMGRSEMSKMRINKMGLCVILSRSIIKITSSMRDRPIDP
jgi:hypothetical protein